VCICWSVTLQQLNHKARKVNFQTFLFFTDYSLAVWHSQSHSLCIQCCVAQPVSFPLHTVLCGTAKNACQAVLSLTNVSSTGRGANLTYNSKFAVAHPCCRASVVTGNLRVLTLGTVTDQTQCLAVQKQQNIGLHYCRPQQLHAVTNAGYSSLLLLLLQSHEKTNVFQFP
jgi:hypothetical protein